MQQRQDEGDEVVVKNCLLIMENLDTKYNLDSAFAATEGGNSHPFRDVVRKEIRLYKALISIIRSSVANVVDFVLGRKQKSFQIEQLWTHILENTVPPSWLRASFETSKTSLGVYLTELNLRLNFWNECLDQSGEYSLPSFWLPAFFNPQALFNSFTQQRARDYQVPIRQLANHFEVQDFYQAESPSEEPYSAFFHGLWLEGA